MPESPSSSAQAAREAVAVRLRDIREDAGLTRREIAIRCGWHESKSSRIERAKTAPSDADIRLWCEVCGAAEQVSDLVTASRSAEAMYLEYKRLWRAGMRESQDARLPLYERTEHFRVYCSNVVPGLTQTACYTAELFTLIGGFRESFQDPEEAAEARAGQFAHVSRAGRRFAFVIEEGVLYHRFGSPDTMTAQLGHLLTIMTLPSVSFGVIPRSKPRTMWPLETFMMFDDARVEVELLTAQVTITTTGEIAAYGDAFAMLSDLAVYGGNARKLITAAIDALG